MYLRSRLCPTIVLSGDCLSSVLAMRRRVRVRRRRGDRAFLVHDGVGCGVTAEAEAVVDGLGEHVGKDEVAGHH